MSNHTILRPLFDIIGRRVPDVWTDGTLKEPLYVETIWNGKRAFFHESGYGYLPMERVKLMRALVR